MRVEEQERSTVIAAQQARRKAGFKHPRKKCAVCESEFQPYSADHVFCSRSCKIRAKGKAVKEQIKQRVESRINSVTELRGCNWKEIITAEQDFVPKPTTPTNVQPGTREKVEVLAARVQAGEELWHELDRYDHEGLVGIEYSGIGYGRG